ncbi:MAG: gliding motility-associated C-terminal domain-containing protein [Sphingobacteriales bacterium]|nr:MAG: gliding motility-associated C-terminal domain-containing protein [Sphingobacteriales bacterium]
MNDYAPGVLTQPTWFRRVVTSGSCQPLISEPVLIQVSPLPLAPLATSVTICHNSFGTLAALNPVASSTDLMQWFDQPEGGNLVATGTTFVTPFLQKSAVYYVQIVNQSCASERTPVMVNVSEPAANAGPDVTIIAGNSVQLQGSGGVQYTWSANESFSTMSTGSQVANGSSLYKNNPTVTPLFTTDYTLTVRSEDGCISTDEVTVTVLQQVQIPNTFSPNNDRINDTWMIAGIGKFPDCKLQIFNQWGELVHTNTGYFTPWDGKSNGKHLPIATYYYILNLNDFDKPLSGSITIIR